MRYLTASGVSVQKRNAIRMFLSLRMYGGTSWSSKEALRAACIKLGFTAYQFNCYFPILQRMGALRLAPKSGKVYRSSIQRLYEQAGCPKSRITVDVTATDLHTSRAFLIVCSGCTVASAVRYAYSIPVKARKRWKFTNGTTHYKKGEGDPSAEGNNQEPKRKSLSLSLSMLAGSTGRSKATASRMLRRGILSGMIEADKQLSPLTKGVFHLDEQTNYPEVLQEQIICKTKAEELILRARMAEYGQAADANRLYFVEGRAYLRLPNIISINPARTPQYWAQVGTRIVE